MARVKDKVGKGDEVFFYLDHKKGEPLKKGVVATTLGNTIVVAVGQYTFGVPKDQVAHTAGALSQRKYKRNQLTKKSTTSVPEITIIKTRTVKKHNPPVRPEKRPSVSWWSRLKSKLKGDF